MRKICQIFKTRHSDIQEAGEYDEDDGKAIFNFIRGNAGVVMEEK
jgi:hypothetical protein